MQKLSVMIIMLLVAGLACCDKPASNDMEADISKIKAPVQGVRKRLMKEMPTI